LFRQGALLLNRNTTIMYQLFYTSIARVNITETDILNIQETSQNFNVAKEITGCLLYHKKEFTQILEGDKIIIKNLYSNIAKDKRHSHVTLVSEDKTETRMFLDWRMYYYNFNEDDKDETGMKHFKEKILSLYQAKKKSTLSAKIFWQTVKLMLDK
jgi:Sensors of blue-light using FAD